MADTIISSIIISSPSPLSCILFLPKFQFTKFHTPLIHKSSINSKDIPVQEIYFFANYIQEKRWIINLWTSEFRHHAPLLLLLHFLQDFIRKPLCKCPLVLIIYYLSVFALITEMGRCVWGFCIWVLHFCLYYSHFSRFTFCFVLVVVFLGSYIWDLLKKKFLFLLTSYFLLNSSMGDFLLLLTFVNSLDLGFYYLGFVLYPCSPK